MKVKLTISGIGIPDGVSADSENIRVLGKIKKTHQKETVKEKDPTVRSSPVIQYSKYQIFYDIIKKDLKMRPHELLHKFALAFKFYTINDSLQGLHWIHLRNIVS